MSSLKTNQKNSFASASTIVFIALSVILLAGALYLYKTRKDVEQKLTAEKEALEKDFQDIKQKFEIISTRNQGLKDSLSASISQIASYVEALRKSKADVASLRGFRVKYLALQKDNIAVLKVNDSLIKMVSTLVEERNSLVSQLKQQMMVNDSLMSVNETLSKKVKEVSDVSGDSAKTNLSATEFSISPISKGKGGKTVVEKKVKKADQLKVCFLLPKSDVAASGDYTLYIKVTDPKGTVLGLNKKVGKIPYSTTTKPYYDKENGVPICEYVNKGKKGFKSGNYSIVVYDATGAEIGSYKKGL